MSVPPAPSDASSVGQPQALLSFARFVFKRAGPRWPLALALLICASLAEGLSILLLIPILSASFGAAASGRLGSFDFYIALPLEVGLSALVGLVAVQAWATRAKTLCLQRVFIDFVGTLRLDLFDAIMGARWRFIGAQRSADLGHLLTSDVERIGAGAINILALVQTTIMLCAYLGISLLISPMMTLFAAGIGVVSLLALAPVRKRAMHQAVTITDNQREQFRTVQDFLSGLKTARAFNAEATFRAKLADALQRMGAEIVAFTELSATRQALIQVLSMAALGVFLWAAIRWFALPLPQIVAMVLIFMRVSPRFLGLQSHIQEAVRSIPLVNRMRAMMGACADDARVAPSAAGKAELVADACEIVFDEVEFSYPGGEGPALNKVSFRAKAGSVLALIGHSGAGKSTIVDLVMALIEPNKGQVRVNGRDLRDVDEAAWRATIGYVGQEVFLLNASVADNLRLAFPSAVEAQMWDALKAAHIDQVVARLPAGLETPIGDRGGFLSGGERQRLALARALLRRPSLLVLDEATSALDWESQNAIANAIAALKGKTTVLIIAHRPSMIAIADEVVVLEQGHVVEHGLYALLAQDRQSHVARLIAAETHAAAV